MPVLFEDQVLAVAELAAFHTFTPVQLTFLDQVAETIGVVLNTIQANMRTEELLEQSQSLAQELQSQSEELQTQQEELQQRNEELEETAATLRASEELLQQQQEELQQTNEELEEKARQLEDQNARIEIKNEEIELARAALEEKAEQLALSSKYKSEFLANMSHELRTPLNSLLILAKLLSDNPEENLSEKQMEFAKTIHSAGSDLLDLINDILDLSKVEAGKMELATTDVPLGDLRERIERAFQPIAEQKGLEFEVAVSGANVPPAIHTDGQRLEQILRNLLSNAFKFTDEGRVGLRIESAPTGDRYMSERLNHADAVMAFVVSDTGIGIPHDKLRLIFEAFQQADGTTSRRYGGTGLGLSISREIASLLGGEIRAESTARGGRDVHALPAGDLRAAARARAAGGRAARAAGAARAARRPRPVPPAPERRRRRPRGARRRRPRRADRRGRRRVRAHRAGRRARARVQDARRAARATRASRSRTSSSPTRSCSTCGCRASTGRSLLDRLKHHPATRHIPVHIVSAVDGRQQALRAGAVAFLEKPVTREGLADAFSAIESFIDRGARNLLVVEDDEQQRRAIVDLVGAGDDVNVVAVGSGEEALAALEETTFDCMVLDLKLPGKGGFALLEQVKKSERHRDVPVIVYTGKDLTRQEETRLRKYAETIIVKDVRSPERLLDETALFLHRVESHLPARAPPRARAAALLGRRLPGAEGPDRRRRHPQRLRARERARGLRVEVVYAENGHEGLARLNEHADVDLVLMDIMMPELDGYQTTEAIRAQDQFRRLPIIALTAKAMKGDREKSIVAGASDYITKPVDTDQLLSLMRVWLYQ